MESFVRLKITLAKNDALDTQEIQKINPDHIWFPGDLRLNTKIVEKNTGCIFFSGVEKNAPLDQHLLALLLRTKSVASKIRMLSERNSVDVWCAIYTRLSPPLFFDNKIIEGIANLGANFDIDLYLLPEKGSEKKLGS